MTSTVLSSLSVQNLEALDKHSPLPAHCKQSSEIYIFTSDYYYPKGCISLGF